MENKPIESVTTFPVLRQQPFELPVPYRELSETGPVAKVRMSDGRTAWVVLGMEEARIALSDPRFSSEKLRDGFPELSPGGLEKLKYFSPFLVNLDGKEHAAARKSVLSEFSTRQVQALRPCIQQIVDIAIDGMLHTKEAHPDWSADLVLSLSNTVPGQVLSAVIGLAVDDLQEVQRLTELLLRHAKTRAEQDSAAAKLHDFLTRIILDKRETPGDDLVSRQIAMSIAESGTVDTFRLASLIQLLQVAGHDSSAAMISLGVLALLQHPEQLTQLINDPSLTPAAVDELLRYISITDTGPLRLALADVKLGGVQIREGDGVVIPTFPVNRDPRNFPNPHTLDIRRTFSSRHVAFGFGAHQCLGQNLVRAELEIVINTLFRRLPNLKLARPMESLDFQYHTQFFGPNELPIAW